MAYTKEVKDYARELWMRPNAIGGHELTFDQIIKKIKTKFPHLRKYPSKSTLTGWSTEIGVTGESWVSIWEDGTMEGFSGAMKDYDDEIKAEEAFRSNIEGFNRFKTLFVINGYSRLSKFVQESGDVDSEGKPIGFIPKDIKEATEFGKLLVQIEKGMKEDMGADNKVIEVIVREATKKDAEDSNLFV